MDGTEKQQPKESEIQAKIRKYLEDTGWLVIRSLANSKVGFPDLYALKKCRAIFIEVKRPGEVPSTAQRFRHDQIRHQGFEVFVHESLDETKRDLENTWIQWATNIIVTLKNMLTNAA